jgi:hypothetical protein
MKEALKLCEFGKIMWKNHEMQESLRKTGLGDTLHAQRAGLAGVLQIQAQVVLQKAF